MATNIQLNCEQLEAVQALFAEKNWDLNILENCATNGLSVDCDSSIVNENEESFIVDHQSTAFKIEMNTMEEKCLYCFCSPCVTHESNKQLWWESCSLAAKRYNRSYRKAAYRKFWTMMYHRDIWNTEEYQQKKARCLEANLGEQLAFHRRDIMPECVVKLVRNWYPNPKSVPYMGHRWA